MVVFFQVLLCLRTKFQHTFTWALDKEICVLLGSLKCVNDFIINLRAKDFECYLFGEYAGCALYADDIILFC